MILISEVDNEIQNLVEFSKKFENFDKNNTSLYKELELFIDHMEGLLRSRELLNVIWMNNNKRAINKLKNYIRNT